MDALNPAKASLLARSKSRLKKYRLPSSLLYTWNGRSCLRVRLRIGLASWKRGIQAAWRALRSGSTWWVLGSGLHGGQPPCVQSFGQMENLYTVPVAQFGAPPKQATQLHARHESSGNYRRGGMHTWDEDVCWPVSSDMRFSPSLARFWINESLPACLIGA